VAAFDDIWLSRSTVDETGTLPECGASAFDKEFNVGLNCLPAIAAARRVDGGCATAEVDVVDTEGADVTAVDSEGLLENAGSGWITSPTAAPDSISIQQQQMAC